MSRRQDTEPEPRAASNQDYSKPGELLVLTFPISSQLSKVLF